MPRPVKYVYQFEFEGRGLLLRQDTKKGRWYVFIDGEQVADLSRKEGRTVLSFIELLKSQGFDVHKIGE